MNTILKKLLLVNVLLSFVVSQLAIAATPVTSFSVIDKELRAANFSGTVIVANGKEIIYSSTFGIANREKNIPFTANTIFDIGSITKQFLATSVLKLVEEDKLALHDTLEAYFQAVPDDKKRITVHQLLSHTSGLPANLSNHQLYDIVPHEQYYKKAFSEKLVAIPGEKFQYSNVGYSLLARIVEKISQLDWEVYLNKNLFSVAGMTETGYRLPQFNIERLAINYGADQTAFQRFFSIEAKSRSVGHSLAHLYNTPGDRWMEGAGGLMSTTQDMYKWFLTVMSRKILHPDSWDKLFTPHISSGDKSFYGYGWGISAHPEGGKLISHNGSNGYSFADFKYYPEIDLFVFNATNDIDNYPQTIMDKLNNVAIREVQHQE